MEGWSGDRYVWQNDYVTFCKLGIYTERNREKFEVRGVVHQL